MKKSKARDSILSMSWGDDYEGEYIDPIWPPKIITSPDTGFELRNSIQIPTTDKHELLQDTKEPAFDTKINQPLFMPSLSLEDVATNA